MIPEIGLMMGAYIFTRLLSLVTREGERAESLVVRVFAVLGMVGTVFISLDLLIRSLTGYIPPALK